ncbi:putative histidine kinase HHK4p [Clohesyomyces aquaticus]|uniref:Putative histidine kinase HHK4p n=1 Tax=Clohesyomyces aquaticus TaxID=1231657 RepID=A0A1Y1YD98_9PLEO|nr:putative histidine kinase HHK4p [Clohesyomyces aquaticus]
MDRAKEREFYRYAPHDSAPRVLGPCGTDEGACSYYYQSQNAKHDDLPVPPANPRGPCPSDDPALTAFAQLGALRLNARRCMISFFDRKNIYILAEATKTLSLQTGTSQLGEDRLAWGTTTFPRGMSICNSTVNLPLDCSSGYDDYTNVPALIIPDLSRDSRFKHQPFVTEYPHCRFYAGVPIRSPKGHAIGSYCVIDDSPRNAMPAVETDFMKDMALTVMRHLEMRRATEDYERAGTMVRSLGSFAEGRSSSEDWWQDPWETEEGGSDAPVDSAGAPTRQRRPTVSSTPTARPSDTQKPVVVDRNDSVDSSQSSLKGQDPLSPASIVPSVDITPVSEAATDSRPAEISTKAAASTKDAPPQDRVTSEVRATFTRAANMILEATESDGCIFLDAKVSTFGGMVDEELIQEQPSEQEKPSVVLGVSLANNQVADPNTSAAEYPMTESVLRYLLRTYPHGTIFNFDDDASAGMQSDGEGVDSEIPPPTPLAETLGFLAPKRAESSKSQDDEIILREVFPSAKTLVLYPLWDAHRDRWYAGAIIWSSDPMRVFTSEQELSYLAAFGNSVMAEVARLDTKLADAAKGDFISSISHELRSPLHGILGSCELLQDTQIDPFQSSMAQTIETCGKTLLDTINHVLDFAKINNLTRGTSKRQKHRSQSTKQVITAGKGHTNDIMTLITDVDLSVLTEEVLETVFAGYNFQKSAVETHETSKPSTDHPPIAIIVDINKSDNFVFRTQPGAWRRILMNLFGNALKYTQAGYIKIKLQLGKSSPEHDVAELRLTISDSGIGMSEDYVNNRIFHSFAQENPLSQGTGLGLSIVKQIIKSLGGDIDVRSQKGYGTKFTVCCPLKFSMLSPAISAALPDRDLWSLARKRTHGMRVSFIGFDEQGDYFPAKNLQNKNATVLTLKALDNLCTDWFGMRVQKQGSPQATAPDLLVATESGAKELRQQYTSDRDSASTCPVVVLCQGAASAHLTTAITVPGQIFECISQPCGPHKMAKALVSCLDRDANREMQSSTGRDSALSNIDSLNLKENVKSKRLSTATFDSPRPTITSTLSAPEVARSPTKTSTILPPTPVIPQQRALNCLAVDDNSINLTLLRAFIDKLGHKHVLATNGVEAVDMFKLKPDLDVVLMDINMPEMDGLEATRQIRAHERDLGLRPVTIIALTGVASAEAQEEAHVSGVNLFLIKPVTVTNLDVVLKGVVRG